MLRSGQTKMIFKDRFLLTTKDNLQLNMKVFSNRCICIFLVQQIISSNWFVFYHMGRYYRRRQTVASSNTHLPNPRGNHGLDIYIMIAKHKLP